MDRLFTATADPGRRLPVFRYPASREESRRRQVRSKNQISRSGGEGPSSQQPLRISGLRSLLGASLLVKTPQNRDTCHPATSWGKRCLPSLIPTISSL